MSDTIIDDYFLVFAAAQPSIPLLFKQLSWGATFFAEFGNYQNKYSNSDPKMVPTSKQNRIKTMKKRGPTT